MFKNVKNIIEDKNSQGTLFVLKGYAVEEYGGEKIELESIIANKIGRLFQLTSQSIHIISFDEFICLYDLVILQYRKIILLENPQYMNLYPVNVILNDEIVRSLVAHFDDDVSGDTELVDISDYAFVYSNFVNTDFGVACCYNISEMLLKSEKIERIIIKNGDDKDLLELESNDGVEDYTNLCNEIDYYQLVRGLESTELTYTVAWESFISGKEVVHNALKYLNGLFGGVYLLLQQQG